MSSKKNFSERSGLNFSSQQLLGEALTHRSYRKSNGQHNERLEFFGDAVLKLIVSDYLFHQYPNFNEGDLTKLRAKIVSDKCLSRLAESIQLGSFLRFSDGERRSGGESRASNLANAFEAILGAAYLDQGYDQTKAFFLRLFTGLEDEFFSQDLTDYKSQLQELLQKDTQSVPNYKLCDEKGPEHKKEFKVSLEITYKTKKYQATGKGASKKAAHQDAAKSMITQLPI